jgi:hypothetical protein
MAFSFMALKQNVNCIPDYIHFTEIHLATDAFHTSPLKSPYVESGEPPLSLWRNLIYLQFCDKTVNTAPSLIIRCSLSLHPLQQVWLEYCALTSTCYILFPVDSHIPPLSPIHPTCGTFELVRHVRGKKNLHLYISSCLLSSPTLLQATVVYTDGSCLRVWRSSFEILRAWLYWCVYSQSLRHLLSSSVHSATVSAMLPSLCRLPKCSLEGHMMDHRVILENMQQVFHFHEA